MKRYRCMCLQETGEEYCIGYANTVAEAEMMLDEHLDAHEEHRQGWFESAHTGGDE